MGWSGLASGAGNVLQLDPVLHSSLRHCLQVGHTAAVHGGWAHSRHKITRCLSRFLLIVSLSKSFLSMVLQILQRKRVPAQSLQLKLFFSFILAGCKAAFNGATARGQNLGLQNSPRHRLRVLHLTLSQGGCAQSIQRHVLCLLVCKFL